MSNSSRPEVSCPHCKNRVSIAENGIWPFCSERCKKLDLGDWANEKFKIPAKTNDSSEDSTEEDEVNIAGDSLDDDSQF